MNRTLGWMLVAIVLCCSAALSADFTTGLNAYEKGDYATALKEWSTLAKAGGSAAQYNLGLLYYDGKGVPQDFTEAATWFQRAAEQGYSKAQHNLGALYSIGKGVKRDYSQAYVWLSLCAASGDDACAGQRDLVAKRLSAAKLTAAQRAAREWKPKAVPAPTEDR